MKTIIGSVLMVFLVLAVAGRDAEAQVKAGPEFRVNSYTTGDQDSVAVGMSPDGRFVIAWESMNVDGSSDGVVGQRYAAGGAAQGANFLANTYTTNSQDEAEVAVARDGSFIVAWQSDGQDGSNLGIFGRRYDASGTALGAEFLVNTYTTSDQPFPNVAIAPNKSFVVIWGSRVPTNPADTFGQRFDAAGARIGGEFMVNTYTTGQQIPVRTGPAVAFDGAGNFVVVWASFDYVVPQDGSGTGVFGQRFAASGARLGGEFQVNTYTTLAQAYPTVAAAATGEFVVVWESELQDGSGAGAFGQRFNASGARAGAEFQVNSYTTGGQYHPTVTADAQGNFTVAWSGSNSFDPSGGVVARRFAFDGSARGNSFLVNTYTPFPQQDLSLASDAVGNFTVSWDSYAQEGPGPVAARGVYAQRFGGLLPRALAVNTTGNGVWEPGETVTVSPTWRNENGSAQSFGGGLTAITGPAGAVYAITDGVGAYGTVANATDGPCTDCYAVSVNNPARPAQHWDASALESITPDAQGQQKRWMLHIGGSFADVPVANPFYRFVETLLHNGVTGGCGAGIYCPSAATTREGMAVFVLVAREGSAYVPPACGATPSFPDVPASSPFCRWIEELARRGVVGGCGGGNYCPSSLVTREQMAVFVLRTLDAAINPAVCVPPNLYNDVPETSGFCRWIEELTNRAVVSGCGGGNYCPTGSVTREQMGVFISVTFGLTLYGP